ncbi:hypothetical protein R6Q59_033648 [Mikania micrantha]
MLTWFRKHNPTPNRLHYVVGTDERRCQKKTTKPSIIRWLESKEVALARAYIDVSEDLMVGFVKDVVVLTTKVILLKANSLKIEMLTFSQGFFNADSLKL